MKLEVMLYCRVDKPLKRKLRQEVRQLRRRGLSMRESDITRLALVEYFELRDGKNGGNGKVAA